MGTRTKIDLTPTWTKIADFEAVITVAEHDHNAVLFLNNIADDDTAMVRCRDMKNGDQFTQTDAQATWARAAGGAITVLVESAT